jgi:hypothetical protein
MQVLPGQSSEMLPALPSGLYRVVLFGQSEKQAVTLIVR